jgi:hypothetical protein
LLLSVYQHIEQNLPGEIEKFQGKVNKLAGQFGYERNIINPQESIRPAT